MLGKLVNALTLGIVVGFYAYIVRLRIHLVDSLGPGDAFNAGYSLGLLE